MNTFIDFSTAKLLKEKGFDEALTFYFDLQDSNKLKPIPMSDEINKFHSNRNSLMLSAPTIADVIMWLYEKHGIWISVDYDYITFNCIILKNETTVKLISTLGEATPYCFTKPEEAYESAIKYVLEKLI